MATKSAECMLISDSNDDFNEKLKDDLKKKLQERDHFRVLKVQQEKTDRDETRVAEEKSSFFTKHFKDEVQNLQNMLNCNGLSPSDRPLVLEHFDAITVSYQRVQKFFNDSVMFLPKYESRKAKAQLTELLEKIEQKRTEMLPKKKFAFKSKSKAVPKVETDGVKDNITQLKETAAQKYASTVTQLRDDCTVANKHAETIKLKHDVVNKKDMSFTHLTNCFVYVYGTPGTVHISHAIDCVFVIGPVSGSVFVERCTNSIIATGCQQLRVHHTIKTDFYLHVTSRAIIEDSNAVRFAPYSIEYPGIEADFNSAGLDLSINNWSSVDDFNWLAMDTKSPNWEILKESERKQNW